MVFGFHGLAFFEGDTLRVLDVLLGQAEPAGRLPVTLPLRIEHTPAFGAFPGANSRVAYTEGVLSGYRWYDTRVLPTRYPFGHGGSYTSFAWGEPTVVQDGDDVVVEVPVTNTGDRPGAEVVQAYVEPPPSRLPRPRRELRAFAKVRPDPGETVTARLVLPPRAFASSTSRSTASCRPSPSSRPSWGSPARRSARPSAPSRKKGSSEGHGGPGPSSPTAHASRTTSTPTSA